MSDIQHYIDNKLRNLYEELVTNALLEKPKNIEMFLFNYLKTKNGEIITGAEKDELLQLRSQLVKINNGTISDSESDYNEEEEEPIDDLPVPSNRKTKYRVSVSAEAFGD